MSSARSHILATIRTALGRNALSTAAKGALLDQLASPKARVVPARGRAAQKELIERFSMETKRVDSTVVYVPDLAAVPGEISDYLTKAGLPAGLRVMPDPLLIDLPWSEAALTVGFGPAAPEDGAGVALAVAGIAETGTLMMVSGSKSPVSVNFLPETAFAVVFADRIVGAYEDAWTMLRGGDETGRFMPRAVNLITGPSRTADIEQTLLLGAHGPMRLHILVICDAGDA